MQHQRNLVFCFILPLSFHYIFQSSSTFFFFFFLVAASIAMSDALLIPGLVRTLSADKKNEKKIGKQDVSAGMMTL